MGSEGRGLANARPQLETSDHEVHHLVLGRLFRDVSIDNLRDKGKSYCLPLSNEGISIIMYYFAFKIFCDLQNIGRGLNVDFHTERCSCGMYSGWLIWRHVKNKINT